MPPLMRALVYDAFRQPPYLADLPRVAPGPRDVLLRVKASGICRSDFHGWQGHDSDIATLPHVPGHEFVGTVCQIGPQVTRWRVGDRVTAPFCCGCGVCALCQSGQSQVCPDDTQPGFTHWGSLAEYVVVRQADFNLVAVPDELDDATAACLGCRFGTAFHAVVDQGAPRPGEWLAVFGCGGLGLSAIMIAAAAGACVLAIDIQPEKLELATACGAAETLLATSDLPQTIALAREKSRGGVHVAIDALGSAATCQQGLALLRPRGVLVQAGLLTGSDRATTLDLAPLISQELRIVGSHGMAPHRYPEMLQLIHAGVLKPEQLIGRRLSLAEAPAAFRGMARFASLGFSVVEFPE